jgi:hypothetical protein
MTVRMMIVTSNYDNDDSFSPICTTTPLGPSNGGGRGCRSNFNRVKFPHGKYVRMYGTYASSVCTYSPITVKETK